MDAVLQREESVWQLQEAKARLSEVVNRALGGTPQLVTRNGHPSVYIVSARTYQAERDLNGRNRKEILLSSPAREVALDMPRSGSAGREIAL